MAAIPVIGPGKAVFQLWLEITAMLLDLGAIVAADTIGASEAAGARAKVVAERDAH